MVLAKLLLELETETNSFIKTSYLTNLQGWYSKNHLVKFSYLLKLNYRNLKPYNLPHLACHTKIFSLHVKRAIEKLNHEKDNFSLLFALCVVLNLKLIIIKTPEQKLNFVSSVELKEI